MIINKMNNDDIIKEEKRLENRTLEMFRRCGMKDNKGFLRGEHWEHKRTHWIKGYFKNVTGTWEKDSTIPDIQERSPKGLGQGNLE